MATKRGGHVAAPASELRVRRAREEAEDIDLSVRQLKGKLSSAGIENAGISDKVELVALARQYDVL